MLSGLYHAHVGWLFESNGRAEKSRYCADLVADPTMADRPSSIPVDRVCDDRHSRSPPASPGAGTLGAGLEAALWAGLVRDLPRSPRDVVDQLGLPFLWPAALRPRRPIAQRLLAVAAEPRRVLAPTTTGRFPRSAFHGLRWYEFDPPAGSSTRSEKLGLVLDTFVSVVREHQAAKGSPPAIALSAQPGVLRRESGDSRPLERNSR